MMRYLVIGCRQGTDLYVMSLQILSSVCRNDQADSISAKAFHSLANFSSVRRTKGRTSEKVDGSLGLATITSKPNTRMMQIRRRQSHCLSVRELFAYIWKASSSLSLISISNL
jgi:hypothetical protein